MKQMALDWTLSRRQIGQSRQPINPESLPFQICSSGPGKKTHNFSSLFTCNGNKR